MSVVIRADASITIGTGHIARCLNLARRLDHHGLEVRFAIRALKGNFIERVREAGFPVAVLPEPRGGGRPAGANLPWLEVPTSQDIEETRLALRERPRPEWLVVDHYGLDREWEAALRTEVSRILVIDDLANRSHDCDVLVDQNIQELAQSRYAGLVSEDTLQLLGPDYALLGAEYSGFHGLVPPREGAVERMMVFFGGMDRMNLTGRTLRALARPEAQVRVETHVIVDARHPFHHEVVQLARALPHVTLHAPRPSLAPLFAATDLAIGAGGVTALERCCLGVPSVVVTAADNQVPGTKAARDAGLLTWIGTHENVDDTILARGIGLAVQSEERLDQSRRGPLMVDGRGAGRVAAAMGVPERHAVSLRRARPGDEHRLLLWANDPEVRRQGFSQRSIDPGEHHQWFRDRLRDVEGCRLFVCETSDGIPMGQVRFERKTDAWTIGYSIDRVFRGRGAGRRVLELALALMQREFPKTKFVGIVKTENTASRRVFERLGFTPGPYKDHAGAMRYVRLASNGGASGK